MEDFFGGGPLSVAEIERLAEAAHEVFRTAMRARGYIYGATTDDARRTHSALRPFAELIGHDQEQNRELARSLPAKLRAAGFAIVPAGDPSEATSFPGELLERLAEDEHARWVRAKLADGWRHAPATDKGKKLHASMIRWRLEGVPSPGSTFSPAELAAMGPGELTEEEREKDRVMIRGIPEMLARAGFGVRALPNRQGLDPKGTLAQE